MSLSQPSDLDVASVDLATPQEEQAIQGRSLRQIAWRRLKHDKIAMAGGVGIIFMTLVAIFASPLNRLIGNSPNEFHSNLTDIDTTMPYGRLSGVSRDHWLGVQPVDGQDILARLIAGSRTSLMISVAAMALS
ncbi:MAG TPA: hypothetical protein VF714_06090, partial [Jatrophihabitans sp.]